MRGILNTIPGVNPSLGITPAHAGNTAFTSSSVGGSGDHPRACGEYQRSEHYNVIVLGSPPRMRGILDNYLPLSGGTGITPAHAGNTEGHEVWLLPAKDHPRACGEYLLAFSKDSACIGSPPRMRGILCRCPCNTTAAGITPAHAGNTLKNPMI